MKNLLLFLFLLSTTTLSAATPVPVVFDDNSYDAIFCEDYFQSDSNNELETAIEEEAPEQEQFQTDGFFDWDPSDDFLSAYKTTYQFEVTSFAEGIAAPLHLWCLAMLQPPPRS
jgi:hypothetical protein